MRMPLVKLHRAFPELDRFSDAQCRDMIYRVVARNPVVTFLVSMGAVLVCLIVFGAIMLVGSLLARRFLAPVRQDEAIAVILLVAAVAGLIASFLIRDLFVRRSISTWILSAQCEGCRYSLIGLAAMQHQIRCPECGCDNDLRARGVDPETLVPRSGIA
jgi:hypothetical protein